MKRTSLLLTLLTVTTFSAFAQSEDEVEIRRLSQLEVESFLKTDTSALEKLWSPEYVVMNPFNKIVSQKEIKTMMKSQKINQVRFERIIERITFNQNIATEMGREIPDEKTASAAVAKDVTNQRRFTNVWMRTGNTWHLIARQATNVCL